MGYMQRGSVNVFMLKNNVFCILFKASDNPFCSPSDTILSVGASSDTELFKNNRSTIRF